MGTSFCRSRHSKRSTDYDSGRINSGRVSRDGLSIYWGQGYNQEYKTTLNTDVDITQKLDILTKGLSVSVKASYDNMFRLNKYRTGGKSNRKLLTTNHLWMTLPNRRPTRIMIKPLSMCRTEVSLHSIIPKITAGTATGISKAESIMTVHSTRTIKSPHCFFYNQSRNYYPKKSDGTDATYQYMPRGYVGFVGRATYGYKSKYLIDVNAGYNGSENFAPGKNRYGLFPVRFRRLDHVGRGIYEKTIF